MFQRHFSFVSMQRQDSSPYQEFQRHFSFVSMQRQDSSRYQELKT
ncbi:MULTISPECIES: hypothetical protein [Sphingobacterium]|nr:MULTISPECIES: hypothetical protein [Sphingobacterium]